MSTPTTQKRTPEQVQDRLQALLAEAKVLVEAYNEKWERLDKKLKKELGPYIYEFHTLNPPHPGRPKSGSEVMTFDAFIEELGISRSWAYTILNAERAARDEPQIAFAKLAVIGEPNVEEGRNSDEQDDVSEVDNGYPTNGSVSDRSKWLRQAFTRFYPEADKAQDAFERIAVDAQFREYRRLLKAASAKEAA